jgi:ribosomal protein S18 acetylase RimI-like enzyme
MQVATTPVTGLVTQKASAADAERLGDFFELLRADPETARFFHPHPLTKAFAASLCARERSGLDRYYLTLYQGRIAGYSLLRGWDEGYETPSFGGCTHPELRGAGLGQWLLAHAVAESRAAGARKLRLTVYKENPRALHIYRKFGFIFSDKNEHECVGLLDLDSAALGNIRRPDIIELDAWLRKQDNSVA